MACREGWLTLMLPKMLKAVIALMVCVLGWIPAQAVILYGLDNNANTTAPSSGIPFGSAPLPFDDVVAVLNGAGT